MSLVIKIIVLSLISGLYIVYAIPNWQKYNLLNSCELLNSNQKLVDRSIKQIVLVEYVAQINAKISACQKVNNHWQNVWPGIFNAVIGKNGLAKIGTKKEGDLKTPEGLYAIGDLFGYKSFNTNMKYRIITSEDKYIDDPKSPQYNSWVKGNTDATSYENMLIKNNTYEIGAVINYNMKPVKPNAGSAIFLHIWKSPNHPTSGCVAMSKVNLYKLLSWLNYADKPHILILKHAKLQK